jgi:hypothetical protein
MTNLANQQSGYNQGREQAQIQFLSAAILVLPFSVSFLD